MILGVRDDRNRPSRFKSPKRAARGNPPQYGGPGSHLRRGKTDETSGIRGFPPGTALRHPGGLALRDQSTPARANNSRMNADLASA